ncbi:SIS domain-containing protein [Allorhodopirellula solitaria]|uniref:Phosphoheptose isomerase n=1 Tax=Allorhodopirellula solitaria TaxID=2527987 RepID=A0A5C5WMU3_9BACT|nr:SIS domain-containing protein [Allorhodopirellula solitaria]TWT52134.1 Phosphoheptose isomerase 1 [Allorhodopirellula solitaria]
MPSELSPNFRDYMQRGMDLRHSFSPPLLDLIDAAGRAVTRSLAMGGRVYFFGNGGSAADAQHLAAELSGRFKTERRPLPGLALTTDSSAVTAIANDYGYESVFERQLRAFAQPCDIAIGISTSGNSPNVVRGLEAAGEMGLATMAWTAQAGGRCAEIADIAIRVPSTSTELVQEIHAAIGHYICHRVDDVFTDRADSIPVLREVTGKAVSMSELLALREFWREAGVRMVWTNGCFDLLHAGHLQSLQYAREAGDVLVVGLNTDASIATLKGPSRPINRQENRVSVLAGLDAVSYVVLMDELDPCSTLDQLRPDFHCKGADYRDVPDAKIPEKAIVERHGGKVIYAPLAAGLSTTAIAEQLAEGQCSSV